MLQPWSYKCRLWMFGWHPLIRVQCAALIIFGVGLSLDLWANAQQPALAESAAASPTFEVASIKPSKPDSGNLDWDDSPGRVSISGYDLRQLIRVAYGLKSNAQVLSGPKWMDSERFDIVAKADDAETAKMRKMSGADWERERSLMLQSLLADRFQLKLSRDRRMLPVYALVVAKSGMKFKTAEAGEGGDITGRGCHLEVTGINMGAFADYLAGLREIAEHVVIDRTGLVSDYDFKMDWTRDRGNCVPPDAPYPGLFTALREQLGLELKPDKAPVDVVVVQSATEPSGN